MISCRFVGGSAATIGDREYDVVGARATFSEQTYRDVVLGRAHFILEADFQKCGFTEDELRTYGPFGERFEPTQAFCEKLELAQRIFRDTFERMVADDGRTLAELADSEVVVA